MDISIGGRMALLGRGYTAACGAAASRDWRWRGRSVIAFGVAAFAFAAVPTPLACADGTATLASQVNAARGKCATLQPDPLLTGVAQRADRETAQYQQNKARFYPFEDPMPVLQQVGYPTAKAKMLNGFGDSDEKSIHGVVVFGWEAIADCTFKNYGVDVLDANGKSFATAILAAAP